jgi:3-isopropylmalate dehydrogenase
MNYEIPGKVTQLHSQQSRTRLVVGVLNGEGVGKEVIGAALTVLAAVSQKFGFGTELEFGGEIGLAAKASHATELSAPVIAFCEKIASAGGAILSGPGGGRYVYDLRKHFSLFYKINPLTAFPELDGASRLRAKPGPRPDIVLVRENLEGLYQGASVPQQDDAGSVVHSFVCSERNVSRLLDIAALVAAERRKKITVIVKRGALGTISEIWDRCAAAVTPRHGVAYELMDVDFAAYQILQAPESFDVIAAPNCFADILADIGGILCGGRGLTYGASYSAEGFGVYQTNHGCAYDLAGKNIANPVGQILALAMLLRESFGLGEAADAVVAAVRAVWAQGWRTADLAEADCKLTGTNELADKIGACI